MPRGRPPRPPVTKTCEQCGNTYTGPGAKYCSHRCYTISRGWVPIKDDSHRAHDMVEMYRTGNYTLQNIGDQYGVTRERVRQLIKMAAPSLAKEMAAEKRLKHFEKKMEKQRLRALPRKCALCHNDFANGHGGQKYCADCGEFHRVYALMIDPHRHERHRLYMALMTLRNPEKYTDGPLAGRTIPLARELFWHWRKHGYLPPPNRDHYVYSLKAQEFIERIGVERWHEILTEFERHYSDPNRKITLRKDPGYDLPGLKS